jgi:hypothetical protein
VSLALLLGGRRPVLDLPGGNVDHELGGLAKLRGRLGGHLSFCPASEFDAGERLRVALGAQVEHAYLDQARPSVEPQCHETFLRTHDLPVVCGQDRPCDRDRTEDDGDREPHDPNMPPIPKGRQPGQGAALFKLTHYPRDSFGRARIYPFGNFLFLANAPKWSRRASSPAILAASSDP